MSKRVKFILKASASIIFLIWAFYKVNWEEVLFYVKEITFLQILLYLAIVLLGILISSYKWKILAEYKNIKLPLSDFFKYYLTGTFINNFMPSFIGGDTYRAYQIGHEKKNYAEAASTVLMDRITGFIGATILAMLFTLLNFKTVIKHPVLILANALIILSFVFDIAVATVRHTPWIKNRVRKFIPEKIIHFLRELNTFNNSSGIITRSIFWSGVFAIIGTALANYFLFLSLGIKVNVLDYLSVIFLIAIVSSVPITINNIGLKEWSYVTFFGLFGVSSSIVVVVSILSRFLQMILSFFALPFYMQTNKIKKEEKNKIDNDL